MRFIDAVLAIATVLLAAQATSPTGPKPGFAGLSVLATVLGASTGVDVATIDNHSDILAATSNFTEIEERTATCCPCVKREADSNILVERYACCGTWALSKWPQICVDVPPAVKRDAETVHWYIRHQLEKKGMIQPVSTTTTSWTSTPPESTIGDLLDLPTIGDLSGNGYNTEAGQLTKDGFCGKNHGGKTCFGFNEGRCCSSFGTCGFDWECEALLCDPNYGYCNASLTGADTSLHHGDQGYRSGGIVLDNEESQGDTGVKRGVVPSSESQATSAESVATSVVTVTTTVTVKWSSGSNDSYLSTIHASATISGGQRLTSGHKSSGHTAHQPIISSAGSPTSALTKSIEASESVAQSTATVPLVATDTPLSETSAYPISASSEPGMLGFTPRATAYVGSARRSAVGDAGTYGVMCVAFAVIASFA